MRRWAAGGGCPLIRSNDSELLSPETRAISVPRSFDNEFMRTRIYALSHLDSATDQTIPRFRRERAADGCTAVPR